MDKRLERMREVTAKPPTPADQPAIAVEMPVVIAANVAAKKPKPLKSSEQPAIAVPTTTKTCPSCGGDGYDEDGMNGRPCRTCRVDGKSTGQVPVASKNPKPPKTKHVLHGRLPSGSTFAGIYTHVGPGEFDGYWDAVLTVPPLPMASGMWSPPLKFTARCSAWFAACSECDRMFRESLEGKS